MAFRPWAGSLPSWVEVCAVEYPGRGSREAEPLEDDVQALASAFAAVAPPLLDRPFAVLGYSLGALVAYEWLRRLQAEDGPAPAHFFACARRAPHLRSRGPPLHRLSTDELVAELERRFDAIPDLLLGEPELLERFLLPLRADLRAVETYAHVEGEPLACSLSAYGGLRDPDVPEAELQAWSSHTRGRFRAEQLDAGHFFLGEPRLRNLVLDDLTRVTG